MKKLKKSVKYILVAGVSLVCVLAIVLGCVFGLKKKDNSDGENAVASNLTAAQQVLAKEIVADSNKMSYQIYDEIPYAGVCNYSQVTMLGKNFFAYKGVGGGEKFCIYKVNADGSISKKELTDSLAGFVRTGAVNIQVTEIIDNYVVIKSAFADGSAGYSLVYFGNYEKPVEIYYVLSTSDEYLEYGIKLQENYFVVPVTKNIDSKTFEGDFDVYFYPYTKTAVDKANDSSNSFKDLTWGMVASKFSYKFFDNSFYVLSDDKLRIAYVKDGSFKVYEKQIEKNEDGSYPYTYSVNELNSSKLLITKTSSTTDMSKIDNDSVIVRKTAQGNVYENYNYSILNCSENNAVEKTFALESGYVKLSVPSESSSLANSFYVYQQKVVDNSLQRQVLVVYYDNKLNPIVKFESLSKDAIVYAGNDSFVTKSKILKGDKKVNISNIYTFSEETYSKVDLNGNVYSNYIVITKYVDGIVRYGLMDLNGNVVLKPEESEFIEIFDVIENSCVGVDASSNYYNYNIKTGEKTRIDGYDYDYVVNSKNLGAYLTTNSDNTNNLNLGKTKIENISLITGKSGSGATLRGSIYYELHFVENDSKFLIYFSENKNLLNERFSVPSFSGGGDEEVFVPTPSNGSKANSVAENYAAITEMAIYDPSGSTQIGTATFTTLTNNPTLTIIMTDSYKIDSATFDFILGPTSYTFTISRCDYLVGSQYYNKWNFSYSSDCPFYVNPSVSSNWFAYAKYRVEYTCRFMYTAPSSESLAAAYAETNGFTTSSISVDSCSRVYVALYAAYKPNGSIYDTTANQVNTYSTTLVKQLMISDGMQNVTFPTVTLVNGNFGYWRYYRKKVSGGYHSYGKYSPSEFNDDNTVTGVDANFDDYHFTSYDSFSGSGGYFCEYVYAFYEPSYVSVFFEGVLVSTSNAGESTELINPMSYTEIKTGYMITGWLIEGLEEGIEHYLEFVDLDGYQYRSESFYTSSYTLLYYVYEESSNNTFAIYNPRSTTGDVTITTLYEANLYTITLNPGDDVISSGTTTLYYLYDTGMYFDEALTQLMTTTAYPIVLPEKLGYTFGGYKLVVSSWIMDIISATGYIESSVGVNKFAADFELTDVVWTPNTYEIEYTTGNGTTSTMTATYGTAVAIPNPYYLGYEVSEWTISNCTTDVTHYFGVTTYTANSFTGESTTTTIESLYVKNLRTTSGTAQIIASWEGAGYRVEVNAGSGEFSIDNLVSLSGTYGSGYIAQLLTENVDNFLNIIVDGGEKTLEFTKNTNDPAFVFIANVGPHADPVTDTIYPVLISKERNGTYYRIKVYESNGDVQNIVNVRQGGTFTYNSETYYYSELNMVTFTTYDHSYELQNPNNIPSIDCEYHVSDEFEGFLDTTFKTVLLNVKYTNQYTLPTITRDGYAVTGWNVTQMDTNCSHEFSGSGVTTLTTTDTAVTLGSGYTDIKNLRMTDDEIVNMYAVFTPNIYNITYDFNLTDYSLTDAQKTKFPTLEDNVVEWQDGEDHPIEVEVDHVFHVSPLSVAPYGYKFDGWDISIQETPVTVFYGVSVDELDNITYTESSFLSFELEDGIQYFKNLSMIAGDIVEFTARWVPITYNIEYDMNDATKNVSGQRTYGTTTAVPHENENPTEAVYYQDPDTNLNYPQETTIFAPSRQGYTFSGWSISGMSDEVIHHVLHKPDTTVFEEVFISDEGTYLDPANPNKKVLFIPSTSGNSIGFKNLACHEGDTVTFTANWTANTYTITYYYTLDEAFENLPNHTNVNEVDKMIYYKIQMPVVFDTLFVAYGITNNDSASTAVTLPTGYIVGGWFFSKVTLEGYNMLRVRDELPDEFVAYNKAIYFDYTFFYGRGYTEVGDINAYPAYDPVVFTIKYYAPTNVDDLNHMSYHKYSLVYETTIEYGKSITLKTPKELNNSWADIPVTGYAMSTNFYDGGDLSNSIRDYLFNGYHYYSFVGQTMDWGLSNKRCYDPANPIYYLYAEYDADYEGTTAADGLNFVYDETLGGYVVDAGVCSLTDIVIPKKVLGPNGPATVVAIAEGGFCASVYAEMNNLVSIVIPDSITEIPDEAFHYCTSLVDVTLPNTITKIGDSAFEECHNLETFVMPDSVTIVDADAFYYCLSLTDITFSQSLTVIGDSAFDSCSSLRSVILPDSLVTIDILAFAECGGLESISFSKSLRTIGEASFMNCYSLTTLDLPNGLIEIGDRAFEECSGITELFIPASVAEIGNGIFRGTNNLESIVVDPGNTRYDSREDCDAIIDRKYYESNGYNILVLGCKNTVIPRDEQIRIEEFAFSGITVSTTDFIIPYNVEEIRDYAFENSSMCDIIILANDISFGLTILHYAGFSSIYVPETTDFSATFGQISGTTTKTGYAYKIYTGYSSDLTGSWSNSGTSLYTGVELAEYLNLIAPAYTFEVDGDQVTITSYNFASNGTYNIPEYVTRIGVEPDASSRQATGVKLHIPFSVQYIDIGAFSNESIYSIDVDDRNKYFDDREGNNVAVEKVSRTLVLGSTQASITEASMSDVIAIAPRAFYRTSINSSLVIPNYYKSIGYMAFAESGVGNLIIASGVEEIQYSAFHRATFSGVSIPASVTLSGNPFTGCNNLTAITLGSGSVYAFSDQILFNKNTYQLVAGLKTCIEIPDYITSVGPYAFAGLETTGLNVSKNLRTIEKYAFFDNILQGFNMNDAIILERIEEGAFKNATSLREFVAPYSVKYIGAYAFSGCIGLKNVMLDCQVANIFDETFYYCSNLTEIYLSPQVTFIGESAFEHCISLSKINIPRNVSSIGNDAFLECITLFDVLLPSGCTLGDRAFSYCTDLSYVYMYSNSSFATKANSTNSTSPFVGCPSISIYLNGSVNSSWGTYWNSYNSYSTDMTLGEYLDDTYAYGDIYGSDGYNAVLTSFRTDSSPTTIEFPYGLTAINTESFSNTDSAYYEDLTTIIIPDTVTSIDQCLFQNFFELPSLETIIIGASVNTISGDSFGTCRNLQNIIIRKSNTAFSTKDNLNTIINGNRIILGSNKTDLKYCVEQCNVTTINYYAMYYSSAFENIYIPAEITTVQNNSFNKEPLNSIIVDAENTVYDSREGCGAIINTSTNTLVIGTNGSFIPTSVVALGNSAFLECVNLKRIEIPEAITSLSRGAFTGCINLEEIILPKTLTEIGSSVFDGCDNLEEIDLTYVTTLNICSFIRSGLVRVVFPAGITEIPTSAFDSCSNLRFVYIPETMTAIRGKAFANCSLLSVVYISHGLTTIGNEAFDNCPELNIFVPTSVESFSANTFRGCSTGYFYTNAASRQSGWNSSFTSQFYGVNYNYSPTNFIVSNFVSPYIPENDGGYETFTYDDTGSGIEITGIYGSVPTDVYIPKLVKVIGDEALAYPSIESITIPENVTTIKGYAFKGTSITSLYIPKSVTSYGYGTDSYSISPVYNPVAYCNDLISIIVDPENPAYDSRNGCNAVIETAGNPEMISGCVNTIVPTDVFAIYGAFVGLDIKSFTLPEGLITILRETFKDCEYLEEIVIPEGVTLINANSFKNCTSLVSVKLPSSLKTIGIEAFYGCNSLEEIIIPSGVEEISHHAFAECSSLVSVTIPSTVTELGGASFSGCSSLTKIYLPSSITSITTVSSGVSNTSLFYDCLSSLKVYAGASSKPSGWNSYWNYYNGSSKVNVTWGVSQTEYNKIANFVMSEDDTAVTAFVGEGTIIELPSGITTIGAKTFMNAPNVEKIVIPSSVTTIEKGAFLNCTSLVSVSIPSSVTTIGAYAFSGCVSLTAIFIPSSVTTIEANDYASSIFFGCASNLQIHCGASSKPAGWGDYWNNWNATEKITTITWSSSASAVAVADTYSVKPVNTIDYLFYNKKDWI